MVVVTMTEDNCINGVQINAECFGISDYCVRLPCVEQEFMIFSLNIDAESMLCNTVFITAGILYKGYNSHQCLPQP